MGGSSCGVPGAYVPDPHHKALLALPVLPGEQWDQDSCPLQPQGAREAHGGHSRPTCASQMHFKCWRYPGIQRLVQTSTL